MNILHRVLVVVAIFAVASDVHADGPKLPPEHTEKNAVDDDSTKSAQTLFEEGGVLFAHQAYGAALAKYKAALAKGDHPMIRYNMAVCELRLERILDAAVDLEAALKFGEGPFTAELYQYALDYQRLIASQVGDLEVSCEQTAINVVLDGKPWFACPGKQKKRVLAGEHVLVGEGEAYMTRSRRVVVAGRATITQKLKLATLAEATVVRYPYPRWIPFTVTGGGVAVALGGLAVWAAGKNQMDQYEADLAKICMTPCARDLSDQPALAHERDSAQRKGQIATVMTAVGGVAAIGGVVMVILNRPQRTLPVEVMPTGNGAAVSWRF